MHYLHGIYYTRQFAPFKLKGKKNIFTLNHRLFWGEDYKHFPLFSKYLQFMKND